MHCINHASHQTHCLMSPQDYVPLINNDCHLVGQYSGGAEDYNTGHAQLLSTIPETAW